MESIKTFSQNGTIIGILVALPIVTLFSYVLNHIGKIIIQKKYPNEIILHYFEPQFFFTLIVSIITGGLIGGVIMPFWIFEDATRIDWFLTRERLPIFVILNLFIILCFLTAMGSKVALTNKRVIRKNLIKNFFLKDVLKEENVKIENIKEIYMFKTKQINLVTKTGEKFGLGAYRSSKKFYEKLSKLLEIEKNKGGS